MKTYLIAFGVPVAFAVVTWFVFLWIDELVDLAQRDHDIFAGTRRDIRGLPETPDAPYDWERAA